MKLFYEPDVDVAYMAFPGHPLTGGSVVGTARWADPDKRPLQVDFNGQGQLIGLELGSASTELTRELLREAAVCHVVAGIAALRDPLASITGQLFPDAAEVKEAEVRMDPSAKLGYVKLPHRGNAPYRGSTHTDIPSIEGLLLIDVERDGHLMGIELSIKYFTPELRAVASLPPDGWDTPTPRP